MSKKNYKLGFISHCKITNNYSFESQFFSRIRNLNDGLTFFSFKVNLDLYKDDHKPSFEISLNFLNIHNHIIIYRNQHEYKN